MPSSLASLKTWRIEYVKQVLAVLRIMQGGQTLTQHQLAYVEDAIDALKGLLDGIERDK